MCACAGERSLRMCVPGFMCLFLGFGPMQMPALRCAFQLARSPDQRLLSFIRTDGSLFVLRLPLPQVITLPFRSDRMLWALIA